MPPPIEKDKPTQRAPSTRDAPDTAAQIQALVQFVPDLLQRLQESLGPTPQAPTPPTQQPLGGIAAMAGALNPQMIPFLSQQANAPAMADYAQRQAAFEQAMQGRQETLGLLGPLMSAQTQQMRMMQPTPRMLQTVGPEGMPVTVPGVQYQTGEFVPAGGGQAFQRYVAPWTFQGLGPGGQAQWFQTTRPMGGGGAATPVRGGGGQPVGGMPSAAEREATARAETSLNALDNLWSAYRRVRTETKGEEKWYDKLRQAGGTLVGESRVGGMFTEEYAMYTSKRRSSLNAYIKAVTGAQFSVKELQRYEAQYPEPWDSEELAKTKMDALAQSARDYIEAKKRMYPNIAPDKLHLVEWGEEPPANLVSAPAGGGKYARRALSRADYDRLSDADKRAWTDGGGTVGE